MSDRCITIRQLGLAPYQTVSDAMHQFTEERTQNTCDEIWLVEHPRVFTQGQAGKAEHVLAPGDIPVVQSDRGGQVTYHGPGQQVMYVMLDLKRNKIGVRELVSALENTVVNTLAHFNIAAYPRPDAPGVYVNGDKICSLGLRIRQGCSFHGLALNIDMDLEPFNRINPCGYSELKMTQVSDLAPKVSVSDVQPVLIRQFCDTLGFHIAQ
ncbi:lipoyl(octanoyl) transferase LipB [Providencia huaxiensis]|uniref:Octanoyltransferase n=2 Tax=Providencia huaxiensis TaxID=2027290 RepID=A0A345LWE7_9GAMM|nr:MULTISPECIES: lipoyl(octanoyl) transferase LipB [Providencia]AXH62437.1 lipoyl(octanoyl) transferase LipB [Providencia huaxiensis]MBN6361914.1 lipoyl(octanoyl) transferase LipB [Providencia huaxiensis]MBQ0270355.1 lipoyl(octanoyl) transferase LipB [Providencia huaxiensis]MBQ0533032.1 lipoyl(octanoyl) transferase LipB [Providencia huaxiensis]MBQ0590499.1 lipoyl(octanoyl) transferase LipB [Providencia huaxiensis]